MIKSGHARRYLCCTVDLHNRRNINYMKPTGSIDRTYFFVANPQQDLRLLHTYKTRRFSVRQWQAALESPSYVSVILI